MKSAYRLAVRGLVVSGAVGAVVAFGSAGVAQAATPGTLYLCSGGSYASVASFPERGGFSTYVVNAGTCQSFNYGGDHAERVDIEMVYPDRYIGSFTYDGRAGANIRTVDGPSFYPF
ncbi:hypothetical protein [Amycolatopsis sp. H20-H5]|uniref:hypothetical protein n=1 Tax=Amycolatopsis sp. H20-H5 TaxID=3046309 RepID=UPI002DBA250E|nr:hypothetical protein [Amycolatopsis sp. H20-H5]MEC3975227.1 hypothetical protein [Amycolatopsis sp. H20-H5]